MKNKNIKVNQRLLLEFVSVLFAVLLGLMLNQWKDKLNNNKLAEQSKLNIRSEIEDNYEKVEDMIEDHTRISKLVDSLVVIFEEAQTENDTLINVNFQLLSSTSWETAKLTQAIVYIDISIVNDIAGVYEFQEYYESIVKDYVLNNIFKRHTRKDKEFLLNIQKLLNSILPIEKNLLQYYSYIQTDVLIEK